MAVADLPQPTVSESAFIRQAHDIVRDLMPHREAIYWVDFLGSMALAVAGLYFYLFWPLLSVPAVVGFFVAGFLLYRALVFTHELAHMAPSQFPVFRTTWNALFGVPFLLPSFFYTDHRVHHIRQMYGTPDDGEYYPFAHLRPSLLLLQVFISPFVPIALLVRFTILPILGLFSPAVRRWTWNKASSLSGVSDRYVRPPAEEHERRSRAWQEPLCILVATTFVVLAILGVIPWQVVLKIAAVYVFVSFVNQMRVWAAHRYVNDKEPMTFLEQMLDSTTIPGGPWSELWAPLGMRYHALHHLFPTMPYHNMPAAHRRLMKQLPPDSPYHATVKNSLPSALAELFRTARQYHARREASAA
jgi:fatty acid desaturase